MADERMLPSLLRLGQSDFHVGVPSERLAQQFADGVHQI